MNNLDGLVEEINIDKEILSTLPQNNVKNKKIYGEKVDELSEKYNDYEKQLLKEIEKRARKYDEIKVSDELKKSDSRLKEKEKVLTLVTEDNSPFEKMKLDKDILTLTFYYRKDLKKVNNAILYAFNQMKESQVDLTVDDFCFNKYVNEYVSALIKNTDSETLNAKFEDIYWKCPEIITYMELNIRYLYFKNEKKLLKFYKDQVDEALKNMTVQEIEEDYFKEKADNIELHRRDKRTIINRFLTGELQEKEYNKAAIIEIVKKMSTTENVQDLPDEEIDKIIVNLIKFLDTLREYKSYIEFKFILDDVKKIYKEGGNYKAEYSKLRKEIDKKEAKVLKLNKKGLFYNEKKSQKQQNELIKELKENYKTLDDVDVKEKIISRLNEHSNLYDALHLASLYYKYLFKCLIDNNKDIEEEEINERISALKDYLRTPNLTILKNIEITEEKDISYIVKDRYSLLNVNITREDLDVDNLESIIKNLEKCEVYYYLRENKIDLTELSEIYDFKKILENK